MTVNPQYYAVKIGNDVHLMTSQGIVDPSLATTPEAKRDAEHVCSQVAQTHAAPLNAAQMSPGFCVSPGYCVSPGFCVSPGVCVQADGVCVQADGVCVQADGFCVSNKP